MPNRAAVSNACAFAGLALYCAMLRPPFFGSLATSSTPDPSGMRISFDCATILIGIVLIVLPALKRFDDKATASRVLDSVSLAAPAGVLLVCAGRFFDVAAPAFFNASVIVLSIGFAALTMNWFREATAISRRHIAAFALGAFVASHLCGAVDLLPRDAAAVLSVLYPLASLALLRAHRRSRPISKPENIDDEQSDAPGALPALPHQQRFFRRLRLLALLLIFIEVLCGAFLRSIYSSGGINYTTASHTGYTYLVSAAIGIVLLLIALRARTATEGTLAVGGTGLVGFAMIVVLLLVLPMSDLVPFITGLYSALLVYLMALIELWRSDADRTSAACAGTFIALYATVSSITASIIPALFSYYGHAPDELLAPHRRDGGTHRRARRGRRAVRDGVHPARDVPRDRAARTQRQAATARRGRRSPTAGERTCRAGRKRAAAGPGAATAPPPAAGCARARFCNVRPHERRGRPSPRRLSARRRIRPHRARAADRSARRQGLHRQARRGGAGRRPEHRAGLQQEHLPQDGNPPQRRAHRGGQPA